MLNILTTEVMKLKRNKLILTCNLIGGFVSILFILANIFRDDHNVNVLTWVSGISRFCLLLVFSVLSALVITFIFQREYTDNTIINTLTAPVERLKFLLGKLTIWSIWHMLFTLLFLLFVFIAAYIKFGSSITFENSTQIILIILKAGILNILTLIPIAWISILQRKLFYPSLIFSFIIIFIGFIGSSMPTIINNIIPWCAVYQLSFAGSEILGYLPYMSITLCSILGLSFAIYSIRRQEL